MKIKELKMNKRPISTISRHKQGYVIEIYWMYGDADGYSMSKIETFTEEEKDRLLEAIETCERMKNAYPNGRGGYDTYNHVEGFYRWFSTKEESDKHAINMEYEPNDLDIQASFETYEVCYYDENGDKYVCSPIFEEEE